MKKDLLRIVKITAPVAFSFSLLTACGPAPTTPSPTPSVTAPVTTPTPGPVDTSTPTPSPVESSTATPAPGTTATPTPVQSASATPTPSGSATASPSTPLASATSDISVVEKTTFNGKIFDDTQAPLDGVTVSAKSLNSSVPYDATNTTAGGSYAFNNAPSGVQIEITVSKPGYTTRRRVEVLKSNKDGDPNANKYDFGAGSGSLGTSANALSDKPEVTVVTPGRNSAGVSPTTSFVLKFSEGMDRATVVDNFEVRSFTSEKLSVDTSGAVATLVGTADINTLNGTRVWDKAAFNVSWNSDDTEATFTFKEERSLPTDKDTDKVPDYQVSLERQDKNIKDKSGISRSTSNAVDGNGGTGAFKLTEGNFERSYKFSIGADTTRPRIDSITAQTAENSGVNSDGDAIKVRYSERMIHYTLGPTIAGGMGGVGSQGAASNNAATAEATAANYKVTVIRAANTLLNQVTWANLGGRAIFDTNDPTHKTVILLPVTQPALNHTVAGRPANASGAFAPTMVLADNSNVTGTTTQNFFRNAGSGTTSTPAIIPNSGTDAGDSITAQFVYTDGTREPVTVSNDIGANASMTTVLNALNALMVGGAGWSGTTTNLGGLGGVIGGDAITFSLVSNAQRVFGGVTKNVSHVVIQPTGAFVTGDLNAPVGGYVTVANATQSLSGLVTAAAATAAGDTISVDFFYTDGSSETNVQPGTTLAVNETDANIQTRLNSLMTGNTGWTYVNLTSPNTAVAAGNLQHVSLAAGSARNGKTVGLARINSTQSGAPANNAFTAAKLGLANGIWTVPSDAAQIQYMLNTNLLSTGGLFTVTETNATGAGNTQNVWNAGDIYTLSLGVNARNTANTQNVQRVTLPNTGVFSTANLNLPAVGLAVFPGTTTGGRPDLYDPGDNVIVMVDTTVLDPAGNSIDSSGDDASANAS